ncbi:hypothetical protein Despr_1591 [Desulfobulbus propionicus DSM 2032]|uniref:Uncharacterized protein n=1 Tax=Desulfobulbus propionicus (strain ATCC 33891 / DSM 2032 / VKM B-1956 / 1pr3) TaxID=577650 RepID=A0A7U3YLS2_DESPD|nr:hypothetical protein [Desulfobulbus propionicus]ADW17743.1 hypothetical protein Despr_1591 [Desulfobulbus propionicus DSM 2032]
MTTPENQRVYLGDLRARWRTSAEQIVEMALAGTIDLWIEFFDVFIEKRDGGKKKKPAAPQPSAQVEMRLQHEVLRQVQGRLDRMLIGAEILCVDDKGKEIAVSNSVGEEWGETSMLALNPMRLFARLNEVINHETTHRIEPRSTAATDLTDHQPAIRGEALGNTPDHPCFAQELQAANACWAALFAGAEPATAATHKASILVWLREQYPHLSKAASERIALIVTPSIRASKDGRRR